MWWVWVVAAAGLGLLELLAPAYIFLGFALGALATGVLVGFGVLVALPVTLAVFAALSLLAWLGLRAALGRRAGDVKVIARDINEN
jgi:membrane protein implicated in regulation of membrane protease activity